MKAAAKPPQAQLDYEAILNDPVKVLALAGCWLDPLTAEIECTDPNDYEAQEGLTILERMRTYFPDQYAEYLRQQYAGAHPGEVEDLITAEISNRLPGAEHFDGMYELYGLLWGPPLAWLGCGVSDEWFFDNNRAAPIARLFHFDDVDNDRYRDRTGRLLSNGLNFLDFDQSRLIDWMFHQTGNSLADNSYEEGSDNFTEGVGWDELDFLAGMTEEAEDIHDCAMEALIGLETDDDRYMTFCSNVVIAYCAGIQEEFYDRRPIHPQFIRAGNPEAGASGNTDLGASVLPLRDRPAA